MLSPFPYGTRHRDALEDIGPTSSAVAQEGPLHDNAYAGAHGFDRLVYPGSINPPGPIDLDDFMSRLTQVFYVGVFVCETAIE